jgi:hypothetical protein
LKLFACINRTIKVYEDSSNVPCFDEKETRQEAVGSEPKDGCQPEDDYCNEEDDCESESVDCVDDTKVEEGYEYDG